MFKVRSDGILSPYTLAVLLLQLAKECLRLLCVLDWIKIVACACFQHESATATVNCSLQLAQRLHDLQDKSITSTAEAVCCVIPIPSLYYMKRHDDVSRRETLGACNGAGSLGRGCWCWRFASRAANAWPPNMTLQDDSCPGSDNCGRLSSHMEDTFKWSFAPGLCKI